MAESIDPNEESLYLKYLASKNKYEPWMKLLSTPDPKVVPSGHTIWVLDIMSSGDVTPRGCDSRNLHTYLETKDFNDGTQLIIFNSDDRPSVQEHVGPMYDIDPCFFRAVVEDHIPEFLVGGQPQHLSLGYGLTIIIQRHNSCNIVLVSTSPHPESRCYIDFCEQYYKALQKRDASFFADAHKNPLLLLLPVLELHATFLTKELNDVAMCVQVGRRKETMYVPDTYWDTLRIMRHEGMNPLKCVELYARSNGKGEIMELEEFKNLKEKFQRIEDYISCTEALARDYVQHYIGKASLEESRDSIKQARISLEESKRTKLITGLAIFFVPISLSTSVFGMNIQELNENGQSLWVFILTTVLILAVTMIIWSIMYQWRQYTSRPLEDCREEESRLTRFYCLLQLVWHGHGIWAWKSGILISLLMDGQTPFLRSCRSPRFHEGLSSAEEPFGHDGCRPCEYIKCHLGLKDGFNLFFLKSGIIKSMKIK